MFGEWFSDAPIPLGEKDAYQNIRGIWGQELAELAALNKSDNYHAKMFISQIRDRLRDSYGRMVSDYPRQTVLIGSTNDRVWIKDPTGGRRFWPVWVPEDIDQEALRNHRDQYWAEALHLFRQKVPHWVNRQEQEQLFGPEQDKRIIADSWEDRIADWLESITKAWIHVADVFTECLGMDIGHVQRAHEMRVAAILQSLGWVKERRTVILSNGRKGQRRVYIRPGAEMATRGPLEESPL